MLKKKKTCEIKQYQLKLRTNKKLEAKLDSWLRHLSAVYNWGLRKIELNAQSKIYFKQEQFINLLANHSGKLDIPSHTIQGILATAYDSWNRCFKKKAKKPKLKSVRNKLNSIPFPDALRRGSVDRLTNKTVKLPSLGVLRYFKQTIPDGNITCSRLIKKAGDWYLCLFIEVKPKVIERTSSNEIGIDPGFKDLLTMSDGVKLPRPVEMSKKGFHAQTLQISDEV
jgi:putative transposase